SRMQTNKALLKLGEKTVIEIILEEMKKVFDEVIISANECDDFSFMDIPIIKDLYSNRGPLAGIYSALHFSKTQRNFITTCDLPLIKYEMIEYLIKTDSEKDIIISKTNSKPERLFGVYKKSVLSIIDEIFAASENDKKVKASVFDLHQKMEVESVEISHLSIYNEFLFLNMNTPEDYEKVKSIYRIL
ncbi:MAG: molybdenum cofactor guanylyltransferase, partial [Ignavibacteriaceae bacterium]